MATQVDPGEGLETESSAGRAAYAARLIVQNEFRFFTLSMPTDVLATTCVVDSRSENPTEGFQRTLDSKRAEEIAAYIDSGFGTIPVAIVLSAQPEADMRYNSRSQVLSFKKHPRAFLILDGQHRVYGFSKAAKKLRVPVVIYNGLNRSQEARLFIDINTKQRPVPNELLLDIKRMAETETPPEALMRDIFDYFSKEPDSVLLAFMSPHARIGGKISRVTFNAALRPIAGTFAGASSQFIYSALNSYLNAWKPQIDDAKASITNSTLFRAMFLMFPAVAQRVSDRYGDEYTEQRFTEILQPFFSRLSKSRLKSPGQSPVALHESFAKVLTTGFAIGQSKGS